MTVRKEIRRFKGNPSVHDHAEKFWVGSIYSRQHVDDRQGSVPTGITSCTAPVVCIPRFGVFHLRNWTWQN